MWALGEGYAAFRDADPAFAAFLKERLDLSIAALQRQTLARYGQFRNIDGEQTPAWLIVDGGDATAEAVLGLSAYVDAGGPPAARTALRQLAEAVAAARWRRRPELAVRRGPPLGAVALDLARLGLADAGRARPRVGHPRRPGSWPASRSATPPSSTRGCSTSGGPDQGRLPTRIDGSQIAYGVDSRLQSLLATAEATDAPGLRRLAGIVAAWYFGANASGQPAYDPATGRTVDGIEANGNVNRNGGAESTIHGLLSMLALDARPDDRRARPDCRHRGNASATGRSRSRAARWPAARTWSRRRAAGGPGSRSTRATPTPRCPRAAPRG